MLMLVMMPMVVYDVVSDFLGLYYTYTPKRLNSCYYESCPRTLPIGSVVVPVCGLY